MSFVELLPVLKKILTNQAVIGTAVAVMVYMNFCVFVANYRKKPQVPKKKKRESAPSAPPKKAPEQYDEEGSADADEMV